MCSSDLEIKIIRFPGGSAGRMTEEFLQKLHDKEYRIYDWNVNLEDGVNPGLSSTQLAENAKKCSRDTTRRIILAHCNMSNKSTPRALPSIISYYEKLGYTFKPIDNDTQEFYYSIR